MLVGYILHIHVHILKISSEIAKPIPYKAERWKTTDVNDKIFLSTIQGNDFLSTELNPFEYLFFSYLFLGIACGRSCDSRFIEMKFHKKAYMRLKGIAHVF